MQKVLLVCLGNICRSPVAEGVLQKKAAERRIVLSIDSAGTGAWHTGSAPDNRMTKAAAKRGYDLSTQKARKVELSDFYTFDIILAMDMSNKQDLLRMAPPNKECDIHLFLKFANNKTKETPDPYYGGDQGFEDVLDLIEIGADGFLDHLARKSE